MYSDTIPVPSKGLFYDKMGEFFEIYHLTTEDEIMMTSPNLFNKGDALYKLLEKCVCQHNDIQLDDILVNDKDLIILWLRENAYGHIIENEEIRKEGDVTKVERFYFDTRTLNIETISVPPDDGRFYTFKFGKHILKLKLLTIRDEKRLSKKMSKLDWYCAHIHSVDGNENWEVIRKFVGNQPILEGKKIKARINKLNFGVSKTATCIINDIPTKTNIDMNELFFGYTLNNLSKINKAIEDTIIFLMNEGNGYTDEGIRKMPTHRRRYHEEKLVEKITKMNEQINQK